MSSTTPQVLAAVLARLSESCQHLDDRADHLALLQRAHGLARDVALALPQSRGRPPPLSVTSLGRFQIVRGGQPLASCPSRKAVAVFRYLLTRADRSAHKAELAELIWPGSAPQRAAHSVHMAVSTLRRYLDVSSAHSCLILAGRAYRINPDVELSDDAEVFQRYIAHADRLWDHGDRDASGAAYVCAVDSYGGDYVVADLDFTWAACERERHLAGYLAALYRLARLHFEQRRFENAAQYLRGVLERDCYREDVHFQLMICYSRLGRRWQAVQQYRHCRELLWRDLGVAPMTRLQELYESIVGTGRERAPPGQADHGTDTDQAYGRQASRV